MRESEFRVYTGLELINTPTLEERYLVEGILWEGDHVFLLGKEKSGKSILALQMACALTCGSAFLGSYEIPEPMQVLYVQTEGKKHETVERIKAMISEGGVTWNPSLFHLLYYHSLSLDTNEGLNHFRQLIQPFPRPRVIFIDPLYMSMQGDLVDNQAARVMVKHLRKISEELSASIVIVHHQHRPIRDNSGSFVEETGDESIFGSFVWKAFADHILTLHLRKDKIRLLSCHTQRTSKVISNVELNLVQPIPLYYEILGEDQKPYVQEVYNYMISNLNGNTITARQLEVATKLSSSAVKKSLGILMKESKVANTNIGHRPSLYGLISVKN
jgi:RecA-family ATPase